MKKYKIIGILTAIATAALFTLVFWLFMDFNVWYVIVSFFAFFGLFWMAALVISVVIDIRREERQKQQRYNHRKASWYMDNEN